MATPKIEVDNSKTPIFLDDSNLKVSSFANGTTIQVYSIASFDVNQPILIGEFGEEDSEIIKTHTSTSPTGNTVTLASGLKKDHPADVKVYILQYDQIEFSNASTLVGSKSVLTTKTITPETQSTYYIDIAGLSGYYFYRFKNSITSFFSDYSDPIPTGGFPSNTVGYIIKLSMDESQKQYTDKLTYDLLTKEINSCLRFVRGKLKRWSSNEVFNKNLGVVQRGVYKIALPTDYYDKNSNRSCLDVRVGTQQHLIYRDKQEFDNLMIDIAHSFIKVVANIGDTTLTLDNSADFPSTGTLTIYVNGVLQSITFTSNDTSTGILSGIPSNGVGSITTQLGANVDVWNGLIEGSPSWYTIYGGYLYWWYPADELYTGKTIYMDYYTDIIEVNSDSDIIPNTKHDMIKHWLKWVIRNITERNGIADLNDADFVLFNNLLTDGIRHETTGQKFKMIPKVNNFYRKNNSGNSYENFLRS